MTTPKKGEVYEAIGYEHPEWKKCVAVATGSDTEDGYPELAIICGAPKGWRWGTVGANIGDWKLLGGGNET